MPTPPKSSDAMAKHQTAAQREARIIAEEALTPIREKTSLIRPVWLTGQGKKYWDSILARAEDITLLDDLDTEMLAAYCSQLEHRDKLNKLLKAAMRGKEPDQNQILALSKQINAQDRSLLAYAEKLGLTPSGRIRLAQKRAAEAASEASDGDLFGD